MLFFHQRAMSWASAFRTFSTLESSRSGCLALFLFHQSTVKRASTLRFSASKADTWMLSCVSVPFAGFRVFPIPTFAPVQACSWCSSAGLPPSAELVGGAILAPKSQNSRKSGCPVVFPLHERARSVSVVFKPGGL